MAALATCTRKGCGKQFDPAENGDAACSFHPGGPVFHEGLKSYSCCSDVNKPVTDFDDFMKIPPCATGSHSTEPAEGAPSTAAARVEPTKAPTSTTADGKEVYGTPTASSSKAVPNDSAFKSPSGSLPLCAKSATATAAKEAAPTPPQSTEYVEVQDDPDAKVEKGTRCKRKACGQEFEGAERTDGECNYHPGVHEGSKGYSCCKRRVLEFDEFLRIEGCRTGRHLFVGPKKSAEEEEEEELVECRVDHYQTPSQVIVSVFGKQANKDASGVKFEAEAMHVDLLLPARKRFTKSFPLYGPIDPSASSYKILGTKCEITLVKADARSWPSITTLDPELAKRFQIQLAFSAGGGRGTVGAKEMVLDQTNAAAGR
ncbi:hypothetical protein JCM10908_004179 [Rhodotorula pacifica]|uniref:cysteine and histidine-rich domain-containing protein n=1 Tax=Rhodotorula pacifica TaxID=1495444 RepID=UPI00317BA728